MATRWAARAGCGWSMVGQLCKGVINCAGGLYKMRWRAAGGRPAHTGLCPERPFLVMTARSARYPLEPMSGFTVYRGGAR